MVKASQLFKERGRNGRKREEYQKEESTLSKELQV